MVSNQRSHYSRVQWLISAVIGHFRGSGYKWLTFLLLVCAPLVALVLSIAPLMVPDSLVVANLRSAVEIGQITPANYGPTASGMRVDQWSDCTMFMTGIDPGASLFKRAVTNPSNSNCEGLTAALAGTGGIPEPTRLYYRYWFGQLLFLRPLIGFFGLATTRLIFMVGLILVAGILYKRVAVSAGRGTAFGLIVGMIFSGLNWNLPDDLVMATSWAALIAAPLVASFVTFRPLDFSGLFVWAMASGMFFAFFHHLLNISIAVTLTVLLGLLAFAGQFRKSPSSVVLQVAVSSSGWTLGFAWMWASTWLFAAISVGPSTVLDNISDQARFRIAGEYGASVERRFGAASEAVILEWFRQPGALLFSFLAAALFGLYLVRQRTIWFIVSATMLVFTPFIILEALSSHSQIHRWGLWHYIPFAIIAALLILRVGVLVNLPDQLDLRMTADKVGISELKALIVSLLAICGGYLVLQLLPVFDEWRRIHPSTFSFRLLAVVCMSSLVPQFLLRKKPVALFSASGLTPVDGHPT